MDCREAEHLFDRYLDREIAISEFAALRQHLQACPRCAANWDVTRKAADLLSSLPELDPGPEVLSCVMMTLPRGRRPVRSFRLTAWQAVAAVIIAGAVAGGCFLTGSQQMIAAAVENRDGRVIVVPRPGRPLVIPPGATILGDLRVQGDVYVNGRVQGKIAASGSVRPSRPRGFWAGILGGFVRFCRSIAGR